MRDRNARVVATVVAVVASAALVVIVTPRIPVVWSVVWAIGDIVTGGTEERSERLLDHPFPAALAPPGYRLQRIEVDDYTDGVTVWFAGPDDENSITYYSQAITAPEIVNKWQRGDDVTGWTIVPAEGLRAHSYCHQGDDVFHETHGVTCVAAFDGMVVLADSFNTKPDKGNLRHALTLLRAGVAHWESIRG